MSLLKWATGLWLVLAPLAMANDKIDPLRVVQSGHSLTDNIMPALTMMVQAISKRGGKLDPATIPGSPMDWRWKNETSPDIRRNKVMAGYQILVLTERAPLSNTMEWHASQDWALQWMKHAWKNGARSVLYGTWVDVASGPKFANPYGDPEGHIPFRQRLPLEEARWQKILSHVNKNRPAGSPRMTYVPGPIIMARAYDDIAAGKAPGIRKITRFFDDDIHLNAMGGYLIALGHIAVVYGVDPRRVPDALPLRGGPNTAQARWMQDLVWEVVRNMRD